jgi:hypothetical protein
MAVLLWQDYQVQVSRETVRRPMWAADLVWLRLAVVIRDRQQPLRLAVGRVCAANDIAFPRTCMGANRPMPTRAGRLRVGAPAGAAAVPGAKDLPVR